MIAQTESKNQFNYSDTLRGTVTAERAWWNVLRYDIEITPEYTTKTISGNTAITFAVIDKGNKTMQIDLQKPLEIDSIIYQTKKLEFIKKTENVWYVYFDHVSSTSVITIFYHGKPIEAVHPPWDGGFIWAKDSLDRPWMSVACEGIGASVWYPCKDHLSDEPDSGAYLTMIVPDTLVAVGNGKLISSKKINNNSTAYKWEVKNSINNYNIIPYIGKYVNFTDTLQGEKGLLDLSYWVLDYNLEKAKKQFQQVKPMLRCFEYWFGPYPFYRDGYKLVDAPHLGMEHQSAVAYGNGYQNGYHGEDLSKTGWGLKWDFIIVHESGHEWFGNNITSKDVADLWIHEGFTNYSETLFTECMFGKEAANQYNYGIRNKIVNEELIIGRYNVNNEGSIDMYYKGGNLIHIIRQVINDDEKFRNILRGLNSTFYHQTVTTQQIENYISKAAGIDLSKVFDQYLRTVKIPVLEYFHENNRNKICYRWNNVVKGFDMPLVLHDTLTKQELRINPSEKWKSSNQVSFFDTSAITKLYYINVKEVEANN